MAAVGEKKTQQSTLAVIAGSPLRVACFMILAEEVSSPKKLSVRLKRDLQKVTYQVDVLKDLGAIELVDTQQVRGAVEHFYRAIERPFCDDEAWSAMPYEERVKVSRDILQRHIADLTWAEAQGTFDALPERGLLRHPMMLDAQAIQEMQEMFEEIYERQMRIQAASDERRSANPDMAATPIMSTCMFYKQGRLPDC